MSAWYFIAVPIGFLIMAFAGIVIVEWWKNGKHHKEEVFKGMLPRKMMRVGEREVADMIAEGDYVGLWADQNEYCRVDGKVRARSR